MHSIVITASKPPRVDLRYSPHEKEMVAVWRDGDLAFGLSLFRMQHSRCSETFAE